MLNIEKVNQEEHEGKYYRDNNICYECKKPITDTADPWEVFIDTAGHSAPVCDKCFNESKNNPAPMKAQP